MFNHSTFPSFPFCGYFCGSFRIFIHGACACYPFRPWFRLVNRFTHKQCLIQVAETFFIPILGFLFPDIYEHGAFCSLVCLNPFSLATLGTPAPSYCWNILGILLNWLVYTFRNIQVHLVGAVNVHVEPFRLVSGGVNASPALQGIVEPTCFLSYRLFSHTHTYNHGLPLGIVCSSWSGKW